MQQGTMSGFQHFQAYYNGEWLQLGEIKIELGDRGFVLSDMVFDIARTFNGKPFLWDRHVDRLYRGLRYLRIDPGLSPEEMMELGREAVRRNEQYRAEVGDFSITPFVTRGPSLTGPPTICVNVKPVHFSSFARFYDEGARGVIVPTRSYSSDTLDPKIKHQARLNFVLAQLEAHDVDPDALPILLDRDGNVTEGTGFNVFLVRDGVLKTPTDRSILQGVSRGSIIELARQLDIPVVEEDLQPYDLYTADEVMFTRTSPRIMPVNQVDNRPVGDEVPGPVTRQLLAGLSEMTGVDIVEQALYYAARS